MNNLIRLIAIAFFYMAIALTAPVAVANPISTDANSARQAAQEVVKSTGVKEQFGQSENGDRLLDKAGEKASKKLTDLSDEANSNKDLPQSKKLFLKNLKAE